ncbi:hypothetical protein P148_SR1C00001G0594 [candidate division SR1 bacterium RAAC1_SR1_1]|nr:hypothetical protein P148_SR1C00001G0594 [candidate division SR1 bacterium RAAC1_SR1_1]
MRKITIIMVCISMLGLLGCSKTPRIENGDLVTISYSGTLKDGEIFESGTKTITIGSGDIIKGIEQALINKKSDQRFNIKITPEEGYGDEYSIYNQQRVSSFIFEKLGLSTETGTTVTLDKITGEISKHEKDKDGNTIIILDVNAPQTRQETKYNIHIEKIEKAQAGDGYTL